MSTDEKLDALLKGFAEISQQQLTVLDYLRSTPVTPAVTDNKPMMACDVAELFSTTKHLIYQNRHHIKHFRKYGRFYFYPNSVREFLTSQQSQQNA